MIWFGGRKRFKAFCLWILSISYLWQLDLCNGQCIKRSAFICDAGVINMTTDGRIKLGKLTETEQIVHVQKLIVANSPSGPFLTTMNNFFESITYTNYREPAFLVPEGNTMILIDFMRASNLRAFVAGPNTHLTSLKIELSALDRLPPTLPKMTRLQTLFVKKGLLTVLRLDSLLKCQSLASLDLSYNRIRKILPITGTARTTLTIVSLKLVGNQLEHLDMSVFASMPNLEHLYVWENRLTRLQLTMPITIAKLSTLDISYNQLEALDLRNLTLPNLATLSLGQNALQQMPFLSNTLPALRHLTLDFNNLTQLDLSYFRPYRKLTQIYAIFNQITTVRTSAPVRLPAVWLTLSSNRITSFNISGCDMPNITTLSLVKNRLTAIPPVLERYPKMRLSMSGNPISCATLLPYRNELQSNRLQKDQKSVQQICDTTSSILVDEQLKACCDA